MDTIGLATENSNSMQNTKPDTLNYSKKDTLEDAKKDTKEGTYYIDDMEVIFIPGERNATEGLEVLIKGLVKL